MKRIIEKSMTLGEFITQMRDGWDFHRSDKVRIIGETLNNIFTDAVRDALVTIRFIESIKSDICTYHWDVECDLPLEDAERFRPWKLPYFRVTPTGFRFRLRAVIGS
jgi:hypothetical protein